MLSYLPRVKCRHEFITITPDGFRYRQQLFHSITSLFRWFKEHFRDPIPGTPASVTSRTPMGHSSYIGNTPSINLASLDPQAIQRAAQNMPSHMYNALSQVASQTPSVHGGHYSGSFGGYSFHAQTPYTPSQPITTPMMTPSYHTLATPSHNMNTPRYQATPSHTTHNWSHPGQTPSRTPSQRPPFHSGSHHMAPPHVVLSSHNASLSNRSHSTPTQSNASSTPKSSGNSGNVDWKKAAAMWANRQPSHPSHSSGSSSTNYKIG